MTIGVFGENTKIQALRLKLIIFQSAKIKRCQYWTLNWQWKAKLSVVFLPRFRRQQNNPSDLLLSVYLYISATRTLFFTIKRKLTVWGIQRDLWFKIRAIRSLTLASSQGCSPTCPSMKSASRLFEIYDQLALWRKGRVRNSTQHHSCRHCFHKNHATSPCRAEHTEKKLKWEGDSERSLDRDLLFK